jgi:Resolvase, N terminal domain
LSHKTRCDEAKASQQKSPASNRRRCWRLLFCSALLMPKGESGMTTTQIHQATTRVALYARVSTSNHRQDPEMQLRELRDYCRRRGFEIAEEYIESGICGSRDSRPALDKLMLASG